MHLNVLSVEVVFKAFIDRVFVDVLQVLLELCHRRHFFSLYERRNVVCLSYGFLECLNLDQSYFERHNLVCG